MLSNPDKPGEMQGVEGLEMLRGQRVVLFQAFATKFGVITTHLFQGIVQN